MYIGPARNWDEFKAARELAGEIWYPSNTPDVREHKKLVWEEPNFPGLSHVVVAVSAEGVVSAVVRLVPRRLRRGTEAIEIAGISSVCVADSLRGRGLSREIMIASVEHARSLDYELTVLFARRAVDHFYPRFDIWGIASYATASVNVRPDEVKRVHVRLRPMIEADIEAAARWHESSYLSCFGWFERTSEQWKFLLERSSFRGLKLVIFEVAGTDCGYAVLNGSRVIEIGLEESVDASECLSMLATNDVPLQMALPPLHALFRRMTAFDFTVSSRRCTYGGHMAGVLNDSHLCERLAERIQLRAERLGLGPRHEHIDGLTLEWDGTKADVRMSVKQTSKGLDATARLIGASLAGNEERSVLAPGQSLDFLSLDEF